MTFRILTACALASALAFSACDDDDDVKDINEEEVITTVNLVFTAPGGSPVTFSFRDLDGPGGTAPVITGGTLMANTTYTYTAALLNEQASPAENITLEVQEEGNEHQLFYQVDGADLIFEYGDVDADGRPIGITGTARTGAASTGTITMTLRHEPNKTAAGVAAGGIANAGGETDVEVSFPVTIQ